MLVPNTSLLAFGLLSSHILFLQAHFYQPRVACAQFAAIQESPVHTTKIPKLKPGGSECKYAGTSAQRYPMRCIPLPNGCTTLLILKLFVPSDLVGAAIHTVLPTPRNSCTMSQHATQTKLYMAGQCNWTLCRRCVAEALLYEGTKSFDVTRITGAAIGQGDNIKCVML
ncbi:hypothetical protein XENTR_v10020347 [Xenopus tropicalis]|nr:hypothetical protein XENTR_v10020347 [Xenopus tropicalis]